ncbi:MAG: hypothetical protein K2J37_06190 [Ruminococcus sp.]|nr:hypothetical protein [Ruminococcus sp.]MDE6784244.1 hypothetical protein [Ruminococcus sp.]
MSKNRTSHSTGNYSDSKSKDNYSDIIQSDSGDKQTKTSQTYKNSEEPFKD